MTRAGKNAGGRFGENSPATADSLTMLAEPGNGTLAGGAHQDTFLQIAKSDAVTLAGVLQNAIDVPLLKEHFPDQPIMAYFEKVSEKEKEKVSVLLGKGVSTII